MASDYKGTGPRDASDQPQIDAVDPCADERRKFDVIQHAIFQLQTDIDSGDFSVDAVRRKKAELATKQGQRPGLELALTKCVALHPPAPPA